MTINNSEEKTTNVGRLCIECILFFLCKYVGYPTYSARAKIDCFGTRSKYRKPAANDRRTPRPIVASAAARKLS